MIKKSLIAIFILAITVSISFAQKSGSLDENIILTDLDGKTYDMYSELDEGKYFLLFATNMT